MPSNVPSPPLRFKAPGPSAPLLRLSAQLSYSPNMVRGFIENSVAGKNAAATLFPLRKSLIQIPFPPSPPIGQLPREAPLREGMEEEVFLVGEVLDADRRVPVFADAQIGAGVGDQITLEALEGVGDGVAIVDRPERSAGIAAGQG